MLFYHTSLHLVLAYQLKDKPQARGVIRTKPPAHEPRSSYGRPTTHATRRWNTDVGRINRDIHKP
jgi:hypothetical protein